MNFQRYLSEMWDAGVVFPETLTTYSGGKNNKVFDAGKAAISFCVKNLGLTPVRRDLSDSPETKNWPIFDLNWHQMEYFPNDEIHSLSPYGVDFVVIRALSENFHKAIQGQVSAKKALDSAANVIARTVENLCLIFPCFRFNYEPTGERVFRLKFTANKES